MQQSVFGVATTDAYLRVDRASGITEFFHVEDGNAVPITESEYEEATAT